MMIYNPDNAIPLLMGYTRYRQEHFGIICLDGSHKVLSRKCLFIGSDCKCMIDIKILFWEACSKKAAAIILFHNHPTGNTNPSAEDIKSTRKIAEACKIMGIQLLDHIIVSKYSYFSFLEHNLLEEDKEETMVAEKEVTE